MAITKNTLIADRYAEALVKIAKDGKLTFEKISNDLKVVADSILQSKDLDNFLTNPIISTDDKKEIIDKVFSSELDALIVNFLKLLVDKNRFSVFTDIINSYNVYLDDINNITRVKVISAVEMTEESQKRLKIKLEEKTKKNVILDLNIDPSIIAGLVLKMGDNLIDMSLKHKFEDLSKNIMK